MINKSTKHKGLVPEYSTGAAEWFLVVLLSQSEIPHQFDWPTASGSLGVPAWDRLLWCHGARHAPVSLSDQITDPLTSCVEVAWLVCLRNVSSSTCTKH